MMVPKSLFCFVTSMTLAIQSLFSDALQAMRRCTANQSDKGMKKELILLVEDNLFFAYNFCAMLYNSFFSTKVFHNTWM